MKYYKLNMKSIFVVGAVAAIQLNQHFAEGLTENEAIGDLSFPQVVAQRASEQGSGVRAKWVELPDCGNSLGANDVPLRNDLTNAAIATCKGYWKNPPTSGTWATNWEGSVVTQPIVREDPQKYSRLGKTNDWQPRQWANSTIADQEHHVTIYKDVDPPAALLAQRGWVELPNCKGAAGEVKLADDLDNATWATCKSATPSA